MKISKNKVKKVIEAGDIITVRIPKNCSSELLELLKNQSSVSTGIINILTNHAKNIGTDDCSSSNPTLPSSALITNYTFNAIKELSKINIDVYIQDIYNHVEKNCGINASDRAATSSNGDNIFEKRIRYSLLTLSHDKLIQKSNKTKVLGSNIETLRGYYNLTLLGIKMKDYEDYETTLNAFIINQSLNN